MKYFKNLEPAPKSGEWFSVLGKEGEPRMVVLIDEKSGFVQLPFSGSLFEWDIFLEPIKISTEEAKIQLKEEMTLLKKELIDENLSEFNQHLSKVGLKNMERFYKKYFQTEEELIKEFAKAKAQEKIGFILFENEGIFIFDPKNKIFLGTHLENYNEQKFNWLKEGLKEYLEENLPLIPENFRKALTYRINDSELNVLIKKLIKK